MSIDNSQIPVFGTELSATMTGSTVQIGSIPNPGALIVFDNQGTASVAIYVNGTDLKSLWKTFTPGEAIVLDLRAASASARNFSSPQNTTFFGNGASGTFSISYIYAQNS